MTKIDRAFSEELDNILGESYPVLDYGFVRVIDYMGNDAAVVQMARTSYGEGTETPSSDDKLIRYLMKHAHTSPFEGCEIKLHVKVPIFVMRQWIRHRTANVNEYSGRYSLMKEEAYVPEPERLGKQSTINKQGTGVPLTQQEAEEIIGMMEGEVYGAFSNYAVYVDENKYDLSRELARINLPLSTYTECYWKIDLHNLLHFLRLRADSHAQWEVAQFVHVIEKIVAAWVPSTYKAYVDYKKESHTLSRMEVETMQWLLSDATQGLSTVYGDLSPLNPSAVKTSLMVRGCTEREAKAFMTKFGF